MAANPFQPSEQAAPDTPAKKDSGARAALLLDILFVGVLLIGAHFRCGFDWATHSCKGLAWDEGTYLHPDERFLAIVESKIQPVASFSEYWNTNTSPLNPNNKGEGFFVYGTLPIFLVRYVMESVGKIGYGDVAVIGRPLAGLFDLLTVCLLYLTANRLYGRKVGLLAAAFSAFAVLQIQLSHFFTVDIFANVFIWAAIYFGVRIATMKRPPGEPRAVPFAAEPAAPAPDRDELKEFFDNLRSVLPLWRIDQAFAFIAFGILTGAAAASKISAFPVAFLLPLAAWAYYSRKPENKEATRLFILLGVSGLLAALTFRIFQPYAFAGPGFFGVAPNPHWLETIGRLQELVEPSSGYPPSVQWFDRPIWFSGQNLTAWGLGWPLGVAAWIGFLWMGIRIFRVDWRRHIVVWAWVGAHFIWQSQVPNPTMRYQLPIYPGMALMAAWGLAALWERVRSAPGSAGRLLRPAAGIAAGAVLVLTFFYAQAFTAIYRSEHPDRSEMTRLEASRWIYNRLPGAFTLRISGDAGEVVQLLPFPNGHALRPGEPFNTPFTPRSEGSLAAIEVPHIDPAGLSSEGAALYVSVFQSSPDAPILATGFAGLDTILAADPGSQPLLVELSGPAPLAAFTPYTVRIELVGIDASVELCQPIKLFVTIGTGASELDLAPPAACVLSAAAPLDLPFTTEADGELHDLLLGRPANLQIAAEPQAISLEVWAADGTEPLAVSSLTITAPADDVIFPLDRPVALQAERGYRIAVSIASGTPLAFSGTILAQETSWDDPVPMRIDGYDGFGGIYKGDNNLELYWEDNAEKVDRFIRVLNAVDAITITSSRQWGSLTRLPGQWPLVQAYYRALVGCPDEMTVETCYAIAEPGMFTGTLGFELVETFQSNPRIFGIEFNTQFAEEAFTVYDHPKVFIFQKTAEYDPDVVSAFFHDIPLPNLQFPGGERPAPVKPLTLSEERREEQAQAATWTDLYNPASPLNRFQPLAVAAWYLSVAVLGLAVFPLLILAFPGLDDRGYPFARTAGLLILAFIVWLPGSYGLAVTRTTLTIAIGLILAGGLALFLLRQEKILGVMRGSGRTILTVEALALAFFTAMLLIRMANPDLWHPWKGGEKPMDFAYFNAILKSVRFPPYDPWFAGGYINYYYYGYVIVGTLVKWLGIVPAVAYNLVIPTLFMLVGIGAFSLGWNLVVNRKDPELTQDPPPIGFAPADDAPADAPVSNPQPASARSRRLPYLSGLAAAAFVAVLGNLGSVRMIFQGYQRVAAPPGIELSEAFFLARWVWAFRGFVEVLTTDAQMPFAMADWYWFPSRAIPAPGDIEPITEFPFFTFLYGDLHAHMIALPLTLLALAWALSVLAGRFRWSSIPATVLAFFIGALTIGALRPTNTWDYPTYLALGMLAAGYAAWRRFSSEGIPRVPSVSPRVLGIAAGLAAAIGLALASWFLYQPYTESYALGYTDVNLWENTHTRLNAYLTHWGLFLVVVVSWMAWETREWLAATPAVAGVRFIRTRIEWIAAALILAAALTALLLYLKISLAVFLVSLLLWAGVLLFRPGLSERKRAVLFMLGTGVFLTAMVETIVLSGDIGRMNTVFKFYLQVWILFGIAAAAALGWLMPQIERWHPVWNRGWRVLVAVLLAGVSLYPLVAGFARMKDRVNVDAPVTLDGMAYMPYATYFDEGRELFLVEDYRAIRWMQENVEGTPVIVEGQVVEYRWGARFSIYTGLPAVLGWNWHQRQQRTGHDLEVWARDTGVDEFYTTTNLDQTLGYLREFDVEYIIVGQMERAYYGGPGLDKFEEFDGRYWSEVYRDGETVIYRVVSG